MPRIRPTQKRTDEGPKGRTGSLYWTLFVWLLAYLGFALVAAGLWFISAIIAWIFG